MLNIPSILFSGFIASIIWFIAGGILYMNPLVSSFYKKYHDHPAMKKWPNQKKYLSLMYLLGALVPCLILSFVYNFLTPISILNFSLIIIGVRMLPRLIDMWVQSNYPNQLLIIELINGSILSILATIMFSLL